MQYIYIYIVGYLRGDLMKIRVWTNGLGAYPVGQMIVAWTGKTILVENAQVEPFTAQFLGDDADLEKVRQKGVKFEKVD